MLWNKTAEQWNKNLEEFGTENIAKLKEAKGNLLTGLLGNNKAEIREEISNAMMGKNLSTEFVNKVNDFLVDGSRTEMLANDMKKAGNLAVELFQYNIVDLDKLSYTDLIEVRTKFNSSENKDLLEKYSDKYPEVTEKINTKLAMIDEAVTKRELSSLENIDGSTVKELTRAYPSGSERAKSYQQSLSEALKVVLGNDALLGSTGIDGYIGKRTVAATQELQRALGITATGKLDSQTVLAVQDQVGNNEQLLASIDDTFGGIKTILQETYPNKSQKAKDYQTVLALALESAFGDTNDLGKYGIDGFIGDTTVAATKKLQTHLGVAPTGRLDSSTLQALNGMGLANNEVFAQAVLASGLDTIA